MKMFRKFTCDALIQAPCKCSKCKPADGKAAKAVTADCVPSVDLNTIHQRFWDRLAGR